MNKLLRTTILAGVVTVASMGPAAIPAFAQEDTVQETHDADANLTLTSISDYFSSLLDKIDELITSDTEGNQTLSSLENATTGSKTIPLTDEIYPTQDEVRLFAMANNMFTENFTGPDYIKTEMQRITQIYNLTKVMESVESNSSRMSSVIGTAYGATGGSIAELGYARANTSNMRLNDYVSSLENSVDLKTSVDLNTRVLLENTQQLNETLKVQSAIAMMIANHEIMSGVVSTSQGD